jgi:hypothetical protein
MGHRTPNIDRIHVFTHLKAASAAKTRLGLYPDGMVELDGAVGQLLKKLEDLARQRLVLPRDHLANVFELMTKLGMEVESHGDRISCAG